MSKGDGRVSVARLALGFVFLTTFTWACTFEPRLGAGAAIPSSTDFSSRHIRFDVQCQECLVVFAAGRANGEAEAEGGWSRSISVNAREVREVSLYVTPAFEGAAIHLARILVEGSIRAEAEGGRGRGLADPIRLTARVSEAPQGPRP